VLVWNLNAETFLESHDQLYGIERVRAKIVDERRRRGDFRLIHTELFHNNLFYFFFSRRSHFPNLLDFSSVHRLRRPPPTLRSPTHVPLIFFEQIGDYRSPLKAFSSDFSSSTWNVRTDLSAARTSPERTFPGPNSTNVSTPWAI